MRDFKVPPAFSTGAGRCRSLSRIDPVTTRRRQPASNRKNRYETNHNAWRGKCAGRFLLLWHFLVPIFCCFCAADSSQAEKSSFVGYLLMAVLLEVKALLSGIDRYLI